MKDPASSRLFLPGINVAETEASRDVLTGLGNRRPYERDVEGAVRRCIEGGGAITLATIDLDGLKKINDEQGHEAGNEHLRRFASVLSRALPEGARAYRWGGDEYAVIFRDLGVNEASEILAALADDPGVPIFSWGVAGCPDEARRSLDLEQQADGRMYEMKNARKVAAAAFQGEGGAGVDDETMEDGGV